MSTTTPTPTSVDDVDPRLRDSSGILARTVRTTPFWVFVVNVVLFIAFTALSQGGRFASIINIQSLLQATTQALILALALTIMMAAGIIDLSLGSIVILASVVGGSAMKSIYAGGQGDLTTAILAGVLLCILTGAVFGAVNGLIITVLKVNSLIATLGTMGAGLGIALIITNGSEVPGMPAPLQGGFGLKSVGGIPVAFLVALLFFVVIWVLMRKTRFGLRTLALGSNQAAAERAGLRVKSHILALTVIGGGMAGFVGFIDLSMYGQTAINGHGLDALAAITAAVIGGAALHGGRVSVPGTLWGALLASILLNGLIVIGVQSFWQRVATGAVLILAVALDQLRTHRRQTS